MVIAIDYCSATSVNATILNLIRKSIGPEKKKRTKIYNDLDNFFGGWAKRMHRTLMKKRSFLLQ